MPPFPRTTRAPSRDAAGGAQDVRRHRPSPRQAVRSTTPSSRSPRAKSDTSPSSPSASSASPDPDDGQQLPAAKRRKLSIRSKQTTLDRFTAIAQSAAPNATARPPNKVTRTQPGGRLEETINGVTHALDGDERALLGAALPAPRTTAPAASSTPRPKKEEKRTLRSQGEGPRLKSELAVYFPHYEDVIFDVPKADDFITVDTVFHVADDTAKAKGEHSSPAKSAKDAASSTDHRRHASLNGIAAPTTPRRTASTPYNGCPSLNFDSITKNLPTAPPDPLTDEHFLKPHRRAERKEKQLRNIEKERAMHEKVQLDRLLEGLQGHDWLRVLGITGITDGEAKKFEPKRDYFVAEVKALVDKFRQWKEQEKRLKRRKELEAAAAALEEAEEEEEEDEGEEEGDGEARESSPDPPSSDLNDSASHQLQQETATALQRQTSFKIKLASTRHKPPAAPPPPAVSAPEEPITSFYPKRHLRDAALGKARHGRSVTAFGHPVPEMDEREFELPGGYLRADVLRANAREKRRRKRASVMDGNG